MTAPESFALKVLNTILNGLYVYDVQLGKNIFINTQYTRLTGYTLKELQTMDDAQFFALFHPEDQQRVADHMEKLVRNSDDMFEIEYRFKTKDGRWVWCLSRDSVFARNQDGRVSQFMGTFFDITTHKEFEEALLKSEKLYRELAANLPNGAAFVVDRELRYVLAEGQAISKAGMKSSDLEGKMIREALDRDLALQYEPYYRSALDGKSFQLEHFSHDRHYATHGRPLHDADGKVYAVLAVSYDITERKRSEMALLENETKFRELFETLTQGVVFQIPPDGHIVDANPAAELLLGLSREELLGRKPTDPSWQIINEDASAYKVDENPAILALRTGQIVRGCVLGVYHPRRKEHRWLHVDAVPQFRPDENQPYMVCALFTDITERKQAQEELAKRQHELQALADNAPDLIFRIDRQMRHVFVNQRVLDITGMQRKEYLGRTNRELGHPPELCDLWEITYRRTFETQEPQEIEFTFESAEGPRNLSMSVVPELSEDGSVETIMGITRDITERKRSETALREINQELNEYAYAITHNLKAPIRAIYNYANFLLEDLASTLEGDPKKYLEGIKDAIALNNKQFEDLETLYRIKNHPLNFEPFELRELLDEMQSMFKNTSDRELIIAQNWPVLSGGRFFMRQILVGLINNGFKFNRADIKRVEAGWQTAAGNRTEIFVRDNGIGIDPQNQQEIFNIFRRLHTQSEYDGTGIGLAVVKRAVEKVGGRLRVESTVGGGSTFYISLPNSILENNHM